MKTYATYLRVSTQKQGRSGLGLDAQRKMCADFISANGGVQTLMEFCDVESGTHRDRKGLQDAISFCKRNGCSLVIAKLDRLARDVEFCFKIVNTGVDIHFTDMPQMNTLLLGVFASVAQYERELTSERTKKALAVKKSQGAKLGASSEKYRCSYEKKSEDKKEEEVMKRGKTKNTRHLESRDVKAFCKIMAQVFPDVCVGDVTEWRKWSAINTKRENRIKIFSLMRDYRDIDAELFSGWDLSDIEARSLQQKLSSYIASLHKSADFANGKY